MESVTLTTVHHDQFGYGVGISDTIKAITPTEINRTNEWPGEHYTCSWNEYNEIPVSRLGEKIHGGHLQGFLIIRCSRFPADLKAEVGE